MSDKLDNVVVELIRPLKETFPDFRGIYLLQQFVDTEEQEDEEDIELAAIFDNDKDKSQRETIWKIVGKSEEKLEVFLNLYLYTIKELKTNNSLYLELSDNGIFFNAELF